MSDIEDADRDQESLYLKISEKAEITLESEDIREDWERVKRTVDAYLEARYGD